MSPTTQDPTLSLVEIKSAIKDAWPAVAWSVRAAAPGVTVSWDGGPTVIEVATVVRPIYAVVVDGSEYEWEPWGVSSVALHRHTSMRQWAAAALSLHYLIDGANDLGSAR